MSGMSRGILLYRSVEFPDPMERGTKSGDPMERNEQNKGCMGGEKVCLFSRVYQFA